MKVPDACICPSALSQVGFLTLPLLFLHLAPLAQFTYWRTPDTGRRATRRSRRSRPPTGARIRCCRRSVPKAGRRSWDSARSRRRRRGFGPGSRGRPSGAPCCCCCPCGCGEERVPRHDARFTLFSKVQLKFPCLQVADGHFSYCYKKSVD